MALPQLNSARYDTVIPSTGQPITYRPYLVKEEKVLMLAMESQDQKQIMRAVKDVITACVHDDINVDELAIFDIESLFLALRSKSVGEKIDLNIKCDKCESLNDVDIDLESIEIPVVEEESRTIMLTDSVGVVLRYPSFDAVAKIGDDLESVDGAFKMILTCIDSIFDENDVYDAKQETTKNLQDFLDSLNSDQFKKLVSFFESMPSIKYNLTFDCVSCKEHNQIELRGLQSFFT